MEKKLFRNLHDKTIAGVASGLADYLQIEVTIVRLLLILSTLFLGGIGLIVYIVLWILCPINPDLSLVWNKFDSTIKDKQEKKDDTMNASTNTHTNWNTQFVEETMKNKIKKQKKSASIVGMILFSIGVYALLYQFDLIPHFISFHKLWPLFFIFFGLSLIVKGQRNTSSEKVNNQKDKATEPIITPQPKPEEKTTDENINL